MNKIGAYNREGKSLLGKILNRRYIIYMEKQNVVNGGRGGLRGGGKWERVHGERRRVLVEKWGFEGFRQEIEVFMEK